MARKVLQDLDEDPEFQIVGIAAPLRDFRLAYYLNKDLYLKLTRLDELEVRFAGQETPARFSFYQCSDKDSELYFYLISNKNSQGILVPEQWQSDFFLVIKGPFSQESLYRFLKSIRQINNVLAAFSINLKRNKKLDNFLSEIELHTVSINKKSRIKKPGT
ncbi:MAG: IPExxxVDY family protein [Bacteroidetes bacterium]|nr:IPExxxVDY family protein [Bacteroidota bacterium]